MVAVAPIEALAHGLESVLSAARREDLVLSPALFDLLYAATDLLGGAVGDDGAPTLEGSLVDELLSQLEAAQSPTAVETGVSPAPTSSAGETAPSRVGSLGKPPGASGSGETIRLPVTRLDRLLEQLGELIGPRLELEEALAGLASLRDQLESWERDWRTARDDLRRLDRAGMLAGVGPLVRFLERNEARLTRLRVEIGIVHAQLVEPVGRLGALTDELQSEVKRLRMVPFRTITESLERVVRDLARDLGKEARLVLVGADTELDRRVLEELKDPLLHLLRNALDHGIEPPAVRQRAGKPGIGRVVVAAAQHGRAIAVEVEDDGAGIDVSAIKAGAEQYGLSPALDLDRAPDRDLLNLIFLPGLSSRDDVSVVSGRGVGLDVVARTVQQLGGRVEVESSPGVGTRFTITLPLMVATARAVLVEAGGSLYAVPTASVERVVHVEQLGSVGGRLSLDYEGIVVPVASLDGLLNRRADATAPTKGMLGDTPNARTGGRGLRSEWAVPLDSALSPQSSALGRGTSPNSHPDGARAAAARPLLVLVVGSQRVALLVDRIVDEQEIVVKPLGYPLLRVRYVGGATILGSGRAVPVLSAGDLVRAAQAAPIMPALPVAEEPEHRHLRVLIADDSHTTRTLERYILEAAGYEVGLASDGLEALQLVEERGCDILVSDVDMPVLDGIALTTRLRQNPRFQELPIILVTSLDSPEDRARGLQAGADAYIVKNAFDQDYLLRTIRELIS